MARALRYGGDRRVTVPKTSATGRQSPRRSPVPPFSCFGDPDEAPSTRCAGQGVVVFFGMAKPVKAPRIGPAQPVE